MNIIMNTLSAMMVQPTSEKELASYFILLMYYTDARLKTYITNRGVTHGSVFGPHTITLILSTIAEKKAFTM